jgi:hypothetical protein
MWAGIDFGMGCVGFVGYSSSEKYMIIVAVPTGKTKTRDDEAMRHYLETTDPAEILAGANR